MINEKKTSTCELSDWTQTLWQLHLGWTGNQSRTDNLSYGW